MMRYRQFFLLLWLLPAYGSSLLSESAARGYWFYHQPKNTVVHGHYSPLCRQAAQWSVECGFIPPEHFMLKTQDAFALEQKEYHQLLQRLALQPNDMQTVLQWQRFNQWVIGKAMRVAYATQFVIAQHPMLDSTLTMPFSQFGHRLLRRLQIKRRRELFQLLSGSSLLVFFSRSDCAYCLVEAPVMHWLAKLSGIALWQVSLDHQQLAGFDQVIGGEIALSAARRLKVNIVPTLFLYLKPQGKHAVGKWIRLATGLTAGQVIVERIIAFISAYRHALIIGIQSGGKKLSKGML